MTNYKRINILLLLLPFFFSSISAQENTKYKDAETLHRSYNFLEAKKIYQSILSTVTDSLSRLRIEEMILQCENGASLLKYAAKPTAIARTNVHIKDFPLYFSEIQERSWIPIPNPLVPAGKHKYVAATLYPIRTEKIIFSAPDDSGSWDIYQTELVSNGLWSEPKLIDELSFPSSDEIFPILSQDCSELYFASDGQYGMGGFDLYVTKWDEETKMWGIPENLGFPYSSTGDDIMYMNTFDGQFTMIASNRDSGKDSVGIYVLEYQSIPVKMELGSISEVQKISHLIPFETQEGTPVINQENENDVKEESDLILYSKLVAEMRSIMTEQKMKLEKLQEQRNVYDTITNPGDKEFLAEMIQELEEEAIGIQKKVEAASAKVKAVEMDFLANGIIPTPDKKGEKQDEEAPKTLSSYQFHKSSYGSMPDIEVQKPAPKFDYSFQILKEARFAKDNTLPEGISYQIQIAVLSGKATLKSLHGLSPVYERKLPSGKYLYAVGLFRTNSEASSCLSQVKKAGFPKAFVIAYENGKSIPLKDARLKEGKVAESASYQILLKNFPSGIPSEVLSSIKASSNKDIAKSSIEGNTVYIIGPFNKKSDADNLIKTLSDMGVEGISLEIINKK